MCVLLYYPIFGGLSQSMSWENTSRGAPRMKSSSTKPRFLSWYLTLWATNKPLAHGDILGQGMVVSGRQTGLRSPNSAGWISCCSGPCRAYRVCLSFWQLKKLERSLLNIIFSVRMARGIPSKFGTNRHEETPVKSRMFHHFCLVVHHPL